MANSKRKATQKRAARRTTRAQPTARRTKPRLLSGGNPQIAKADGDAAVQTYIRAMPGWKRDVGERLDALVERVLGKAGVRKAVRWNSPFYGAAGKPELGWFMGVHCITKYVKVAFFMGASLEPMPPVESKQKNVRYLHIYEGDWGTRLDEKQLEEWIRQAARLPGMGCF